MVTTEEMRCIIITHMKQEILVTNGITSHVWTLSTKIYDI